MPSYTKLPLSSSVDGKHVLVSSVTSGSSDQIHTPQSGTGSMDEVWLYAYNEATASIQLSLLWGGGSEPQAVERFQIPSQSGRTLIIDGKIIRNALTVYAYAGVTNVIVLDGFVNRVTL